MDLPTWNLKIMDYLEATHFIMSAPVENFTSQPLSMIEVKHSLEISLKTKVVGVLQIWKVENKSTMT